MTAPETDPVAEGQDGPVGASATHDRSAHEEGRHVAPDDARQPGPLGMVTAAVREVVVVVVMALVLSFIVKTWLLQAFFIPSGSMEDTLLVGDRVIVSKLTPGPVDLKHGDVVVFQDPGGLARGGAAGRARRRLGRDPRRAGVRRPAPRRVRGPPDQAGHRPARRPRRLLLARTAS